LETEQHQDRPEHSAEENDAADRQEIATNDLRLARLER
jgi:hypothetical protein